MKNDDDVAVTRLFVIGGARIRRLRRYLSAMDSNANVAATHELCRLSRPSSPRWWRANEEENR